MAPVLANSPGWAPAPRHPAATLRPGPAPLARIRRICSAAAAAVPPRAPGLARELAELEPALLAALDPQQQLRELLAEAL